MTTAKPEAARRVRDVRLDVFRGLCLVIIFIAHVWDNAWARYIPARFGFSDATEIFVFCSGMASAIAFGGTFRVHGYLLGALRVAHRCWQVFWSHIGVLMVAVAAMIAVDRTLGTGHSYVEGLGLEPLLGPNGAEAFLGILTLRWVPFYFDILPMYLVILALIPLVMAAIKLGRAYVALLVVATWAAANLGLLHLPAEPWSQRAWFFNPFAWQLVFFTGFAFMSGWLPAPPRDPRLIRGTIAVVALTVPFAWAPLLEQVTLLQDIRHMLEPLIEKTRFGILRYVHFLSLAYLAYVAVGEGGHRLRGPVVDVLRKLGQQSLAVFMAGLVLSFLASTMLNVVGRTFASVTLVNVAGILVLVAVARIVTFFKSEPWAARRPVKEGAKDVHRQDAGLIDGRGEAKRPLLVVEAGTGLGSLSAAVGATAASPLLDCSPATSA